MDTGNCMSHPSALLNELESRAKKRFGQHFLASPGIVRQIITVAQLEAGSRVLEIGPGLGVLTEALLGSGAAVTAVELDRDMADFIRSRLPSVRLIEADGAQLDLAGTLEGSGWRCVSNLPYNAGTRMITNMLQQPGTFERLVVMVQKEVADRLVAPAGDRKRGSLSVFTEARAAARIRIKVPPGAFHPPPKVRSAVVDLKLLPQANTGPAPIAVFDQLVRNSFVQPRKTIRNNLVSAYTRDVADAVLDEAKINPTDRPAVLVLEQFHSLAIAVSARLSK